MKKILIAPSLLSCDFTKLGREVKKVEAAGADLLHIDVMDGHFVPNITIGVPVVKSLSKIAKRPLDVHLMIENPQDYIKPFAEAGADILTIHIEACKDAKKTLKEIKRLGVKPCICLKPKTSLSSIKKYLDYVDMVLMMTVNPGFGGQAFIGSVLPKIKQLRQIFKKDIEVDGGINPQTAKLVKNAGANVLVAGTAVFGKKDYRKAIEQLRNS